MDILDLSRFLLVDSWAVSNFGILHNFGRIQSNFSSKTCNLCIIACESMFL